MRGQVIDSRPRRHLAGLCVLVTFLVAGSVLASTATADSVLKFKEDFGSVAQPVFSEPSALAVDRTGDLLVIDRGANTISRFNPDGTPANFSALGTNVIEETGGSTPEKFSFGAVRKLEIAVDNSGTVTDGDIYVTLPSSIAVFRSTGEYLGQLQRTEGAGGSATIEPTGVAVGPAGELFIAYFDAVQKYSPSANPPTGADFVASFPRITSGAGEEIGNLSAGVGPTAGSIFTLSLPASGSGAGLKKRDATSGQLSYALFEGGGNATAVDPGNGNVLGTNENENEVIEYEASGASEAVELSRLAAPSAIQGLAVGPANAIYVSLASGVEVWNHVPTPTVATSPPSEITPTSVRLNGSVNPEGLQLTECAFEYGPTSSSGFTSQVPCDPEASAIAADSAMHEVHAVVTGLQLDVSYRFRLVAGNINGTSVTKPNSFSLGVPEITEVRARDASQSSVMLEAKVNPRGFLASYRFEWGPTATYGHRVPADIEPTAGGVAPVLLAAELSGLEPGTIYHYRVVTANSQGPVMSPDHEAETLDSCGLPDQRCLELVSPRNVGPVAQAGLISDEELFFQAAQSSGLLAYNIANGLPDATKGAQVLYQASRGVDGWASTQVSPPILERNETKGPASRTAKTLGLSTDLSCGIVASNQLLSPDPATRLVIEAGGSNLYRRNADGTYTAISSLAPENTDEIVGDEGIEGRYGLAGFSRTCQKVVFSSSFRYPGVAGVMPGETLYEWNEGTLRSAGFVPGTGGEVAVPAIAGSGAAYSNAVSEDGRRVFFTAERQLSSNPAEVGKTGVFVRENGTVTRDLSLSETPTADEGAKYQYATPDGSRVFFVANAGLTVTASPVGKDLYEYNLETDELTDLTATTESGGAQVAGVLGASRSGSTVYFAASGKLVPHKGSTLAENESAKTLSIYGETDGIVSYVGAARSDEITNGLTTVDAARLTSRVSADGRFLSFETRANVTGYVSGGVAEAYLYDADSGSSVCLSCRQDGLPSISPPGNDPFSTTLEKGNRFHQRNWLTERGGKPVVFFTSFDQLAPGAVAGQANLYEWSHDQVFFVSTEPLGGTSVNQGVGRVHIEFAGANQDGTDLYFTTPSSLTWEDGDDRWSMYDARVGGGFAQPPAGPGPCNTLAEGGCNGPASAPPPSPAPGTSTFTGPGNKKHKKHQKHKKNHHKKKGKKHQKKGKKHNKQQRRHASNNRRAGQ